MVNVTLREFVLAKMVCPHGRRTTVVCLRQAEQRVGPTEEEEDGRQLEVRRRKQL